MGRWRSQSPILSTLTSGISPAHIGNPVAKVFFCTHSSLKTWAQQQPRSQWDENTKDSLCCCTEPYSAHSLRDVCSSGLFSLQLALEAQLNSKGAAVALCRGQGFSLEKERLTGDAHLMLAGIRKEVNNVNAEQLFTKSCTTSLVKLSGNQFEEP